MRYYSLIFLFLSLSNSVFSQIKILFDATKAESAGNADWVIDADTYNVGFGNGFPTIGGTGTEANPQRFPSPAQSMVSATTSEDFWKGGLSAWAVECAKKGYQVETLAIAGGKITYNDASNVQDLSNYKIFIVCEPNILFTTLEKTAILQYVQNGGNLIMIGNHTGSDRNFDGFDSPMIWNDLMANNNPFGITFNGVSISETTTNIPSLAANPLLNGPFGNVNKVQFAAGNTMTLDPSKNATVKGIVYKSGVSQANQDVLAAYCTYGTGKVFAIADSSPPDDGSGDTGDTLYDGWEEDANGNHRKLFMNVTTWMVGGTTTQALSIAFSNKTDVNCFGGKTGKVTVNITGGTAPYTYLWSNSASTSSIENLEAGTYSVTVSGGSSAIASVTITQGKMFTGNFIILPITCSNPIGQLTANISNNAPPYTYKWSDGVSNTISLKSTLSTTYTVTITDAKNCTFVNGSGIPKNVAKPTPSISILQTACETICATALVAGNTANFDFEWSSGMLANTPNKACFAKSEKAKLTVTSKTNGCVKDSFVNIVVPKALFVSQDKVVNATNNKKNGTASVIVSGGTPPYGYGWSDSAGKIVGTTKDLTGVGAGVYTCKVSDASTVCQQLFTVQIQNIVAIQNIDNQYIVNVFPNPINDFFYIEIENQQAANVVIYDVHGRILEKKKIGINTPISIGNYSKGVYLLEIKIEEQRVFKKIVIE